MKREIKRQQTKRLLLDTTKELLREKGCTKTTLNDIMERSGLSKGAIFHYVKGKDELLALVLEENMEETNSRFLDLVGQGRDEFEGPMRIIANSLPSLQNSQDLANQILMYLLGKNDQPAVQDVIRRYYEHAVQRSKQWITTGQKHGVIPKSVSADKMADLFMLVSLGLRVRGFIPSDVSPFDADDFAALISGMLQPKNE